jgi:hypothetical protein
MPQKTKPFWSRPEGVTGAIILVLLAALAGYVAITATAAVLSFLTSSVGTALSLLVLGTIVFLAIDKNGRTIMRYMFQNAMRWLTGLFVNIDPIGVLKSYIQDLRTNLTKMSRQMVQLRGQMHQLREVILNNKKEIDSNLSMASEAAQNNRQAHVLLKSRKAGRLKESNLKLEDLHSKMQILYRVLAKMFENSSILVEDVEDQVKVKEQERKAITASNSAMRSAMSVLKGDPDKKAMFDAALEAMADDVSQKVGEMERFMDISKGFMESIDLQNGVFEEEGLRMLEKWENESISLILGGEKQNILHSDPASDEVLDLNSPVKRPEKVVRTNQYDNLFD